jgi:hypothetical protein
MGKINYMKYKTMCEDCMCVVCNCFKNKTPKEKANELVDKYINIDKRIYDINPDYFDLFLLTKSEAKQCALVAVDEIINNVLNGIDLPSTWGNYWKQVKQEIENI